MISSSTEFLDPVHRMLQRTMLEDREDEQQEDADEHARRNPFNKGRDPTDRLSEFADWHRGSAWGGGKHAG